jgi:hypothetical protein
MNCNCSNALVSFCCKKVISKESKCDQSKRSMPSSRCCKRAVGPSVPDIDSAAADGPSCRVVCTGNVAALKKTMKGVDVRASKQRQLFLKLVWRREICTKRH